MRIIYIPKPSGIIFTPIKYGALYNWYAATDGRGIAPTGWHLPSNTEWTTLTTYLGGTSVAGGHLKETGTTYWDSPNTGADNSSGFNGRGGGERISVFQTIKNNSYYWSATAYSSSMAWFRQLNTIDDDVFVNAEYKYYGKTIRLLCDSSTDPGSVTDYDGNVYPTVKIGDQVWMAANLAVEHYNNGYAITEETDNTAWAAATTGLMCWYNNDKATYK